jgi:hypothetical protein
MLVTVSPSDLGSIVDHGSVWEVTGTSEDGEQLVTFAGDWRPMHLMEEIIADTDDSLNLAVEDWQIRRIESVLLDCGCPRREVDDLGHQEGCTVSV